MSLKNITKKLIKENEVRVAQEAEQAKLNQEMIAYQNDKPFIDAATAAIQNIFDNCGVNNSNINKGEGAKAIKALEDIFTKRFGVKVIFGSNSEYSTHTLCSGSTIGFDYNNFVNLYGTFEVLDKFKEKDPEFYNKLVNGTIDFNDPKYKDQTKWFKELGNISFYSILDQVKKTGLTLDVKNAKIVNPPKNYSVYISSDWYHYTNDLKIDPKEQLSVLLHEFGHNWYQLENMMKLYANVDILNDTLREDYGSKNKTPVETMKIFYNKTKLDMPKNIPNNIVAATVMAYKDIIRGSQYSQESVGYITNEESSADEFSSRFGLGSSLVTALEKLSPYGYEYDAYQYDINDLKTDIVTGLGIGMLITGALVSLIPVMAATSIGMLIAGGIGLLGGIFTGYNFAKDTMSNIYSLSAKSVSLYDNVDRRYKKVRNTTIRRLNWVTDVNVKKQILKDIEDIDNKIKPVLANLANSKLRKITEYFAKDTESFQEQKLNELLEDLNANEIHVAANLFKTLKV